MERAASRRENGSPLHAGSANEPQAARGVLLINLGSPQAPNPRELREYLREFLSDPAVIQLPRLMRWFNKPLGRMIARFRCKTSAGMYQSIWTENGSPLIAITNAQVAALQEIMPRGWRVYSAMRYGHPSIPDVLRNIEADGIEEVVVVPMYPQYSGPTTGTAMKVVYDYLGREERLLQVTTRLSWYNDHSYISAQAQLLTDYAKRHGLTPDNTYLLFSAHGLPVSYVRKGDPYPGHIAETVALVADRMGWPAERTSLAFQSRFGPAKWLQPYTDEVLKELAESSEKRILVCPISFTVDCLETLEEIDERYRELVEHHGSELFLCPALNTFKPFINGLKHLVLQGCSPINGKKNGVNGVGNTSRHGVEDSLDTRTLIMVGASTGGQVESGRELGLHHTNAATLKKLKRPACAVPELLRDVVEAAGLEEAFIWNTCHRFELYGWVEPGTKDEEFEKAATIIRERFLEDRSIDPTELNMLCGKEAHHHLLRTASGLNSGLPGERDVLQQLHAAQRLAEQAGTADKLTRALLRHAVANDEALREKTNWGSYSPDYAQIALQYVADNVQLDWLNCKVTVMGGSTTSAAVLNTLADHFGTPSDQLTLVYRGHKNGNHLKVLRKAIRNGKRIRVQSYAEATVDRALAAADIVIFGIDREEPIVDAERLRSARGEGAHPLTIVDFNTFSSTRGLADMPGVKLFELEPLDKAVNASVGAMCADAAFVEAYNVAEDWIDQTVSDSKPKPCTKSKKCQCGKCSDTGRALAQRSTV